MEVPISTYAGYGISISPGSKSPVLLRKIHDKTLTKGETRIQLQPTNDFLYMEKKSRLNNCQIKSLDRTTFRAITIQVWNNPIACLWLGLYTVFMFISFVLYPHYSLKTIWPADWDLPDQSVTFILTITFWRFDICVIKPRRINFLPVRTGA